MCELAVESTSTWLMVDPWEAGQDSYQRTAVVLQHFEEELNGEGGGVRGPDGQLRKIKIMLLAGGDLIESFGEPGIWAEPDVSCPTLLAICPNAALSLSLSYVHSCPRSTSCT
jgi:nicotinamide mononucleotide adenylyltransferase